MNPRHDANGRSIVNDRDWLAARVAEGLTNDEIAELAGVSKPRVTQCLASFGLVRYTRDVNGTNLNTNRCLADPNWLWAYVEAGWTLPAIAKAAGVATPHTVLTWINRHGFHDAWKTARARVDAEKVAATAARNTANKSGPKYPGLRDLDWLEDAVAARGAMAVSKEIGCHVSSVIRALERGGRTYTPLPKIHGGRPPKTGDPRRDAMLVAKRSVKEEREARMVALLNEGKSRSEVAREMGVSPGTVSGVAKRNGLPPGKAGRPPGKRDSRPRKRSLPPPPAPLPPPPPPPRSTLPFRWWNWTGRDPA